MGENHLERLHYSSNQKQKDESQPSKVSIWVSKRKNLVTFYSIPATAEEPKQGTRSGMKDPFVPTLPHGTSEGPDELGRAMKAKRVG